MKECRSGYGIASVGVALWVAPVEAGAQGLSQEPTCAPMAQSSAGSGAAQGGPVPRIDIEVTRQGAGWAATLRARYPDRGTGTRHLEAASCAELQRAIAVSLSLLDASGASSTGSPSAAAAEDDAAAEGATAAPPDDAAAPSGVGRARPAGGDVAARGAAPPASVALGALSETSALAEERSSAAPMVFVRGGALVAAAGGQFVELGAVLSGGMWLGSWGARFELSARESVSRISAERNVEVEIQRLTAALDVCNRASRGVEWGVCGGPRLELVAGLPSGASEPAPDVAWLPGVGAGVWMRWPIASDWALWSELQGNVSPWASDYELPRLGASLLAGAEWATR